jgi:RNA polymerase-interacting CarD/CdnL/TRCF family regulator
MLKKEISDLKINDFLVYPLHGIGCLEKIIIDKKTKEKFYKVKFVDSQMIITIPEKSISEMNIRKIVNKTEIKKIINNLSKFPKNTEKDWRIRFKDTFVKLKSGDINEMALITKELFVRSNQKPLSMIERKQFETAFNMLVKEIAISTQSKE